MFIKEVPKKLLKIKCYSSILPLITLILLRRLLHLPLIFLIFSLCPSLSHQRRKNYGCTFCERKDHIWVLPSFFLGKIHFSLANYHVFCTLYSKLPRLKDYTYKLPILIHCTLCLLFPSNLTEKNKRIVQCKGVHIIRQKLEFSIPVLVLVPAYFGTKIRIHFKKISKSKITAEMPEFSDSVTHFKKNNAGLLSPLS